MSEDTRIHSASSSPAVSATDSGQETGRPATGVSVGDLVLNSYRVEREVARGGMGALYDCTHDITGDRVAIKAILDEYASDARAIRLFEREAKALGKVSHDAVVRYKDILRDDRSRLFLIMDYVDGQPMSEFVGKGRLPEDGVEILGARLSEGLDVAHKAGVAHRDISPKNVLLPEGDIRKAVIIDFGIAKNLSGDEGTIIGDKFAGTLRYAAPEQMGLFGGKVDQRADIYSLGVVLAEAAGVSVDLGGSIGEAALKRQNDIVMPDEMGAALKAKIERMLKADPAQRPATMQEAWAGQPSDEPAPVLVQDELSSPTVADKLAADGVGGAGETERKRSLLLPAIAVLIGAIGAGVYFFGEDVVNQVNPPLAVEQTQTAKEIVEDPNTSPAEKISASIAMIGSGVKDDASIGLGALTALSGDGQGKATLALARMRDPEFFSAETSPFARPSIPNALRYYRKAAEQGMAEANERIKALEALQ